MRLLTLAMLALSLAVSAAAAQTNPPPTDGKGGHDCESKKDEKPTA